jgi:hypothetical protein
VLTSLPTSHGSVILLWNLLKPSTRPNEIVATSPRANNGSQIIHGSNSLEYSLRATLALISLKESFATKRCQLTKLSVYWGKGGQQAFSVRQRNCGGIWSDNSMALMAAIFRMHRPIKQQLVTDAALCFTFIRLSYSFSIWTGVDRGADIQLIRAEE